MRIDVTFGFMRMAINVIKSALQIAADARGSRSDCEREQGYAFLPIPAACQRRVVTFESLVERIEDSDEYIDQHREIEGDVTPERHV